MVEKFQVLLPEWLADYIHYLAEKYDMKISEVIRIQVSAAALTMAKHLYPEFETDIEMDLVITTMAEHAKKHDKERVERVVSKLLFETRKAIEYRIEKDK
jgi:uncharacterized alpha/beta hydrolase family protein